MNFFEWMKEQGKGEMTWEQLAQKFGYRNGNVTKGLWRRHQDAIRAGKSYITQGIPTATTKSKDSITGFTEDIKKGEAEITAVFANEIRTLDELIAKTKIDTDVWKITKYVQNYWGNGNTPHWQVKAWLCRKKEDINEKLIEFIDSYKSKYVPLTVKHLLINKNFTSPVCCFIALTDVHLDKQTVDGQTIELKVEQYHRVLDTLLYKAYTSYNIDEIVFTIGHDLFNTDTFYNTTTNGTQQYPNTEWDSSYEIVFDSQVKAINKLKQFCNKLHIKYIPSNHARTKEYFLVHALSIYFATDDNIIFDRIAETSKVYLYGENFIGVHHGDVKSLEKLVPYFSQKYYKEWGQAKYKSLMVGDKHTRKSWNTTSTEVDGVRMYQTPHMGGYGQWDMGNRFELGIQSGIAMIFDKQRGRCAEFEEII